MNDPVQADRPSALSFLRTLVRAVPRRTGQNVALMLGLGLTEWIGVLLLIPLLALVGLNTDAGAIGQMAGWVSSLLERMQIRLTLPSVLAVFVELVALRAWLKRLDAVAATALDAEFTEHLRGRLYGAIVRTSWLFFARRRLADFSHALTTELDRISTATSQVLRLLRELVLGLVYLALAFILSAPLTAITAAIGLVFLLALRRFDARALAAGEALSETTNALSRAVHEHLGGLKAARSYGAVARNEQVFRSLSRRLTGSYTDSTMAYATGSAVFAIGSALVLGLLVYLAVRVFLLPAAAVLLLLALFSRVVPRFSGVIDGYRYFLVSLPAFGTVMRLIHESEAAAEAPSSGAEPLALRHRIDIERMSFQYLADAPVPTIADLSISIPASRTTAIVGPSGAGKSTVADLLLGLLTPDSGTIRVDGTVLTQQVVEGWRQRIGYVAQDTFLLHDTVRANLLWAEPNASEGELRESLRQAAADGFVTALPQGIDTMIGDRGVLLSGGERQRLALARALLRKPALLILDEATSALDSENERRIQQAIGELHGHMTILVITHRLSTVREADAIHVLETGRLVESGTWESLLADSSSRFRKLCAAQGIEAVEPVA